MKHAQKSSGISSIRSVERAIDLVETLERSRIPMRLTDLAHSTAMPMPTVQRILGVLERRGLVSKIGGRYQIGVGVVPLAHAFLAENNLTKAALPVLQELAQASGETATLFVRHGSERVVVQRVESAQPLRYGMPIGQRLPLTVGSAGLVLAAGMPDAELDLLLRRVGDVRLCGGKVLTPADLRIRLEQVRGQGFAITRGERIVEMYSISAPVGGGDGSTVAAVTVTAPCSRITEEKSAALSIEVRQAAEAIALCAGL
jgi:IclR family acetate operon transcriptional repressor